MTPQPPSLDPVAVAVALFAAWLGPTLAHVIGAYFVIILSASAGAGWALMRREKRGTASAVWFILLVVTTSTLTTVGVAYLTVALFKLGDTAQNFLLPTVSLFISAVGTEWPHLIRWLGETAVNLITVFKGGNNYGSYPRFGGARPADEENTGAIRDD